MALPQQLPLNVLLRDDATLDNYLFCESNLPLRRILQGLLADEEDSIVYLHGSPDSGKSHLLQACCHLADPGQALYLPMKELVQYSPEEVLQGIEAISLVCLDDIHAVLGNELWELSLFHFYNRARQAGCRLLVSAHAAPRALNVGLADLASRLSWGLVYRLMAPDDTQRNAILCFRAARRGLHLSPEVASYILDRAPRSVSNLLEVLENLDKASLVEQRALSIPFVRKALQW
jgi:DnaA family protein